jgi:ABC-type transport system involved in multi-copper enzyme maturation permease subunit
MTAIVLYGFRESLRRRMFLVVLVLTAVFLALYAYGAHAAFKDTAGFVGLNPEGFDTDTVAGAIVFGLAMFGTLFLGAVLAVFLTLNVVRGDAEAGLLQPLVVRPIGRVQLLTARFAGAAAVCAGYVLAVYFATLGITLWAGDWTPDHVVAPGLELAAAVVIVAALSLLGSVFLSATANGIAALMVFGAGLLSGLLGEIGHAIESRKLQDVSRTAWWFVPFDALYEDALHRLTSDTHGFAKFVLELGPFGGSHRAGAPLLLWAVAYVLIIGALALLAFSRRDL